MILNKSMNNNPVDRTHNHEWELAISDNTNDYYERCIHCGITFTFPLP